MFTRKWFLLIPVILVATGIMPARADDAIPELVTTAMIGPSSVDGPIDPNTFPPGPSYWFGDSVAVSGDDLMASMPMYHDYAGRIAVFRKFHDQQWVRIASLDAPANESFGDVAMKGDVATVGAANGLYVFHRSHGIWRLKQKLGARGSMAISNDFLFVDSGDAILVYGIRKDGAMMLSQRLTAASAGAAAGFGFSIAASDSTLVVGDSRADDGAGAAYVFVRHHGRWIKQQTIQSINGAAGDQFGTSVDLSGDLIAVGAPGAASLRPGEDCFLKVGVVFLFHRFHAGWFEAQRVVPEGCFFNGGAEGASRFGTQVRLHGSTLVASTEGDYPNVGQTFFLYQNRGRGPFSPIGVYGLGLDQGGGALALSKTTLVVGVAFGPFPRAGFTPGFAEIFDVPRVRGHGHDGHDDDDCD